MKTKVLAYCLLLGCSVSACIKDEALNSEAAIDGCSGEDIQTVVINADAKEVDVYVNMTADYREIKLKFRLPEGATIAPDGAVEGDKTDVYNFDDATHTRRFIVTSEDKLFTADYAVTVKKLPNLPTHYSFEILSKETPYHILGEENKNTGDKFDWASGNPGFFLTNMLGKPDTYPTVQAADGLSGKCVKLTTLSTGGFGASMGMPIAAGNLFIGSFAIDLNNTLRSTEFGVQFYKHPVALKGHYKYQAGTEYMDNGQQVVGKKDRFDIYAILFKADDVNDKLNGTNALTSPKLVAVAQIPESEAVESNTWREFEIPFVARNNQVIDKQLLLEGRYKLSIVFSSSVEGASFKGALNSTLYIDEVELVCEEDAVSETSEE
jgi:hypothetical protein